MSFDQILGQDWAISLLKKNLMEGRLSQAYLFYGPQGIGKKQAGYAMAQVLLCPQRLQGSSCGHCPSCQKFSNQGHSDFHAIEVGDEAVKIDAIRSLLKRLSLKPMEGGHTVVLIDNVENMTESASNALLKTLEEPPPSVVFILITASHEQILPTILSRCQKIPFQPLGLEVIQRILIRQEGWTKDHIEGVIPLADGSVGRALQFSPEIKNEFRRDFFSFLGQLPKVSFVEIQKWAENLSQDEENYPYIFLLIQTWVRDALLLKMVPQNACLIHPDLLTLDLIPKRDIQSFFRDTSLTLETEHAIEQNANKQLAFERLFLRFGASDEQKILHHDGY